MSTVQGLGTLPKAHEDDISLCWICARWENCVFHVKESESHSGGSEGRESGASDGEMQKLGLA